MTWQDLLQKTEEYITVPWTGESHIALNASRWRINGYFPREHAWSRFKINGRKAFYMAPEEAQPDILNFNQTGYLVGNLLLFDGFNKNNSSCWCPKCLVYINEPYRSNKAHTICSTEVVAGEQVYLAPPIERFSKISVGRTAEDMPLVFKQEEMSFLGIETDILKAFEDKVPHEQLMTSIKGIIPALSAAYRLESWQRDEAEKIRLELERKRREEEERLAKEARRKEILEKLGSSDARRVMAKIDFQEAARAALAIGGAEFLDFRKSRHGDEHIVKFRYMHRRFECTCDLNLRVIDSGVCLTGNDTRFTLESLPLVLKEAIETNKLVVFRHA